MFIKNSNLSENKFFKHFIKKILNNINNKYFIFIYNNNNINNNIFHVKNEFNNDNICEGVNIGTGKNNGVGIVIGV